MESLKTKTRFSFSFSRLSRTLDGGLKHNDWPGVSDALESPWNSLAVGFFPCQGMLYSESDP